MSLRDLLKDMGRLETNLQRFEARFGVKSQDFYDAMLRGELEELDHAGRLSHGLRRMAGALQNVDEL